MTQSCQGWLAAQKDKLCHNYCVQATLQAVSHDPFHRHNFPQLLGAVGQISSFRLEMQFWPHWHSREN